MREPGGGIKLGTLMSLEGEGSQELRKPAISGMNETPLVQDAYETRTRQVVAMYKPRAGFGSKYLECL